MTYVPQAAQAQSRRLEGGASPLTMREIWLKNREGLDDQQQERLWQLLLEFQDSEIDTGEARPKCRPRRLPLARQEACDQAVEDMLQAGVIEPCDSPWASAVVMVPKKNGTWRLCPDYRPVNGVTKKDSYPLPHIDESLGLVSGSSWFSALDLRSGYYQVPLSQEARPKTAFCTGRGLWQFQVLSFGLCNAPDTFARLMDRVLSGIPRQQCLVYLDDILAHGSSLESLRRVLEWIRAAGLKLHPEKCHFMRREVQFLGHTVGGRASAQWKRKCRRLQTGPPWLIRGSSRASWAWLPITGSLCGVFHAWLLLFIGCYKRTVSSCGLSSARGRSPAFSVP